MFDYIYFSLLNFSQRLFKVSKLGETDVQIFKILYCPDLFKVVDKLENKGNAL